MEDIFVQVIDMDVMIPEHVVKNQDDSYTIFLNARFNQEQRLQSYLHAVEHINNGDFDKDYGDVQEIETAAHKETLTIEIVPTPAALPNPVITVAENIKQPPKRRRRRRNRKKEQYAQDRLNFILENFNSRDTFAMAEHQWLYGNGL